MVTTSPSYPESSTVYQEPEDSRIALLISVEVQKTEAEEDPATGIDGLPEVWSPPRKEALPARMASRLAAFAASAFPYFDWLCEPPMTKRGRVNQDIAKERSELDALFGWQL